MKLVMYSNPKTGTSTVEYNARISVLGNEAVVVNRPNELEFDALAESSIDVMLFLSGHRMSERRVLRIKKIDPKSFIFTLFRSPAEQIVSAYNYDMNYKYGIKIPFEIWYFFLIPRNPQASHFVRRFKGNWFASFFLSKKNFHKISEAYDIFNRVILTENIDREIPPILNKAGLKLDEGRLIRRKATGEDYVKYLSLNPVLKHRLEKDNQLDLMLYNHFKKKT